jgi:hypothetical protein
MPRGDHPAWIRSVAVAMLSLLAALLWVADAIALEDPAPGALPPIEVLAPPREPEQVFWEGEMPGDCGPFTPSWKPQWLQRASFEWNSIAGRFGSDMGENEFAGEATFAAPWIVLGSPWLITPHFGLHALRGPEITDMPAQLYDMTLEFGRVYQLTPRFQLETAYGPAFYSDLDQGRSEALRITGRLVGRWALNTTTEFVFGATYLGRYDYPVLPVAGVVWAPSDLTRLDLVFPYPRFRRRLFLPKVLANLTATPLANRLGYSPQDEYWWYLRGDLGGNTYAIERASGASDMVTIRDFRVAIGYERRSVLGLLNRSEIGYVFARDLKYSSDPQYFTLSDALLFRSEYAF